MASSTTTFAGVSLSVISLVTLTVQNSALTIVLHYSRISVPADKMYSAGSAVLLNECLKGTISLSIAFYNALNAQSAGPSAGYVPISGDDKQNNVDEKRQAGRTPLVELLTLPRIKRAAAKMRNEVFSSDCWKLSIPACLYVVQNNLQFVAASNLDVPTFQVTYNLKILTTALFSVVLLRRRLTSKKWLALLFLAAGVGVVQLQSTAAAGGGSHAADAQEMDKFKGLLAVASACMTSGLAGVYFEMVLKGSKADLWIRNVQLSFFSLLPALVPVLLPNLTLFSSSSSSPPAERQAVFAHFGIWAWTVVLIQVIGGLVTALVIKFSDNIMKGFATSLAIVLSFVAGIILFDFQVTTSFLVGTVIVVGATYLYNAPDAKTSRPNTYQLNSVNSTSPTSSGRHFIPAVSSSPPNRLYSHHVQAPSLSQGGSQSGQTALRSGPFQASPPTYRRTANVGSISGSHTPDHVVGFSQGLGILENSSSSSAVPDAFVNHSGPGINGSPHPTPPLSRNESGSYLDHNDVEGTAGLQLDTKNLGLAGWVPYSLSSASSSASDKMPQSLAQRKGLNDGEPWESPMTP